MKLISYIFTFCHVYPLYLHYVITTIFLQKNQNLGLIQSFLTFWISLKRSDDTYDFCENLQIVKLANCLYES